MKQNNEPAFSEYEPPEDKPNLCPIERLTLENKRLRALLLDIVAYEETGDIFFSAGVINVLEAIKQALNEKGN